MGLCQSEEAKDQSKRNRSIDNKIRDEARAEKNTFKLLLLGAGECGKSTLMKQMRFMHNKGFSEEELLQQRAVVYSNTVHAMADLLKGMEKYNITFRDESRRLDAKLVFETIAKGKEQEAFSDELAVAMKRLWEDPSLNKATYSHALELNLQSSTMHFLDSIDRISNPTYRPSDHDILLTRIRTTGVNEQTFTINAMKFRVFDVGGQRSERKKWIHCFENVDSIIFVAAASEYDEVLFEDGETNRMVESMRIFESICNSRWFLNTSIILFLNKKDLFEEKIKRTSIRVCFKEYDGFQTYEHSMAYIKQKFVDLNANPQKMIYVHETCATDTDQVQMILDSVTSIIVQTSLGRSGLY
ncbi:unnamed protein product [Meloidogyne enterolobii]|uniref:Uncharacterized protein n=4 Tax=Meloidogyne enterolobii TaxID=390850 RepID=A0A6V7U0X3_MELEN|nr:unnamed protein product [Meloidogyne enterolobii]CAD2147536.1 unnamed protein product [Meloidogyne enterolobii]CAD2198553.1 unnamed protein product [Meloidogyne enterolobii]